MRVVMPEEAGRGHVLMPAQLSTCTFRNAAGTAVVSTACRRRVPLLPPTSSLYLHPSISPRISTGTLTATYDASNLSSAASPIRNPHPSILQAVPVPLTSYMRHLSYCPTAFLIREITGTEMAFFNALTTVIVIMLLPSGLGFVLRHPSNPSKI
ncbi:hypothetical protein BGX38DRAFT_1207615 [Terfezia claveryi]|nr:hypothetical protein BGX38DRAFT_1207615 [Terfezia claveryi]